MTNPHRLAVQKPPHLLFGSCYARAWVPRVALLSAPSPDCRPHARASDVVIAGSAHCDSSCGIRGPGVLGARRSRPSQGRRARAEGRGAGAHGAAATQARGIFRHPATRGATARQAAAQPKARRAHLRSLRAAARNHRLSGRHRRVSAQEPDQGHVLHGRQVDAHPPRAGRSSS